MGELGSIHVVPAGRPEADLLAVGCFEKESPPVDGMEEGIRRAVERLAARPGWKGKEEQAAQTDAGADGPVVSLHSLGCRQDLTAAKLSRWLYRAPRTPARTGRGGWPWPCRPMPRPPAWRPPAASCAPWRSPATGSTASRARPTRPAASSARRGAAGRARRRPSVRPCPASRRWRAPSPTPATSPTRRPTRPPPPGWRSAPASSPPAAASTSRCWAPASCAPAAWAACSPSAPAPPTSRAWCACDGGTAVPVSPWSARGSPSTAAASRSSRRPTWTT